MKMTCELFFFFLFHHIWQLTRSLEIVEGECGRDPLIVYSFKINPVLVDRIFFNRDYHEKAIIQTEQFVAGRATALANCCASMMEYM